MKKTFISIVALYVFAAALLGMFWVLGIWDREMVIDSAVVLAKVAAVAAVAIALVGGILAVTDKK